MAQRIHSQAQCQPISAEARLKGRTRGLSAQATVVLGLGANVPLAGTGDSIAFQPLGVEGQTGLNIAAGLSKIELELAR